METIIYTQEGKANGSIALPDAVFGTTWNADLVHGVVTAMQANARANTAHTKGRGEVQGGGKKPWKQKGTGRARHGSRRSPIWVGGGIAHGPRNERDYVTKINRKVRAKALATVLSKKQADGEVIALEQLTFAEPKTALAKTVINALAKGSGKDDLATKRKNAAIVVVPKRDELTEKSFQNFGHIVVAQAKDINPVDLLTFKYVIITEPASTIATLEKRVTTVSAANEK
jgi:large subunit ribosomal protein L4